MRSPFPFHGNVSQRLPSMQVVFAVCRSLFRSRWCLLSRCQKYTPSIGNVQNNGHTLWPFCGSIFEAVISSQSAAVKRTIFEPH
jgi:hypothetical protein